MACGDVRALGSLSGGAGPLVVLVAAPSEVRRGLELRGQQVLRRRAVANVVFMNSRTAFNFHSSFESSGGFQPLAAMIVSSVQLGGVAWSTDKSSAPFSHRAHVIDLGPGH